MIDQHASLAEKFIKKGIWLYLFSFIIGPIGYSIKILIADAISVSDFGILYGILSIMVLVSAFNDFGFTESILYFIPKFIAEKNYDKVKSILVYTLLIQIITGATIAGVFYFGADFISERYFDSDAAAGALQVFSLFFLGINFFQVITVFFLSIQNTFFYKLLEFIRLFFVLLATIYFFAGNSDNILDYSIAWILGVYAGILIGMIFFIKNYYIPYLKNASIIWEKKFFQGILIYAGSIFISSQMSVVLSQIDMQMILYFLGTTDAGYYASYLSIIGIPFLIIGPIFALLFPLFSELQGKNEIEKIRVIKYSFQKNFLVIAFAMSVFLFVFSDTLTYILFGEKFIPAGNILQYSSLFLCFNFLLQMNFNILSGAGKIKERLKITSYTILLSLILNFIFIQWIGVEGGALASGISWIFIWKMSELYLGKTYKVSFDFLYISKNILALIILGGIMYFGKNIFFLDSERIILLFKMLGIGFLYSVFFLIINKKEFGYFLQEVKKLR